MRGHLEDGVHPGAAQADALLERCVSIDLEVDPKTNRMQSFGGVRSEVRDSCVINRGSIAEALERLDHFSDAAEFVLGHNFISFYARHLEATKRDLRLLRKPIIDTLWLNPLAFPRNPYHRLVKHYQDGRLQAEHITHTSSSDMEPVSRAIRIRGSLPRCWVRGMTRTTP